MNKGSGIIEGMHREEESRLFSLPRMGAECEEGPQQAVFYRVGNETGIGFGGKERVKI